MVAAAIALRSSSSRESGPPGAVGRVEPGGFKPAVTAILAFGARGQWSQALEFLDSLLAQGAKLSPSLCRAAISVCSKAKRWERAMQLLSSALSRGLEPNLATWNAAISSC
ncbi:unnamed protein product, partial [Polarella glacialis]